MSGVYVIWHDTGTHAEIVRIFDREDAAQEFASKEYGFKYRYVPFGKDPYETL